MSTLVDITKQLVRIPSLSSDIKHIHRCIDFIADYFHGTTPYIEKVVINDTPSLIVKNFDGKEADIILNGHIDVVPTSQEGQCEPIEKEGKLYARGAGDMKAGISIIMKVMHNILTHQKVHKKIMLMITSDEEIGGHDGVGALVERGYTGDVVLIPDGGSTNTIVQAQKGIYMITVEATGQSCHSSRPRMGENAIHNIVNYFTTLRSEIQDTEKLYSSDDHRGTSINFNVINAGSAINQVPDKAVAQFDIRFTEMYNAREIQRIAHDLLSSYHCTIVKESVSNLFTLDTNHANVQKYVQCAQQFATPIQREKEHGGSDGRFFSSQKSQVIIHRPTCGNIHAKDEWVNIDSIYTIYSIYNSFIHSY